MIAKILKSVAGFPGVSYNTNKVDKNKGELLKVANFGPLQALTNLRPQDYINYLQMISALNSRVTKPQFHAVLSAKGKSYDKNILCMVAEKWLQEMGYGDQPYLVVFHKDTENNHVHVVTTRVDREGGKIDSAFEKIRAVKSLDKALGYSLAMDYTFSTKAQFYTVLEAAGFYGRDFSEQKLLEKIDKYRPDTARASTLKQLFESVKQLPDFTGLLHRDHGVELVFHSAEDKAPYGYTIIDHESKHVFKGSEVMPLKQLLSNGLPVFNQAAEAGEHSKLVSDHVYVGPVRISDDIDDEAIHGRNRRRKKTTRSSGIKR